MDEGSEVLTWLFFVLNELVLLVVIGAALALVRRASASSAYMLAAAAGVQLLLSCCARITVVTMRDRFGYSSPLMMGLACVDMLGSLITVALIAYAFVTLSRVMTGPPKPNPVG